MPFFFGDRTVGAAQQGIGLNADFAQLLGRVLRRLRFELACRCNPGHVTQMHKSTVVGAELQAELAHRFQKGQRLDVTHGAANFHNGHIDRLGCAKTGTSLDEVLNFVGHVRDDLHGFTQVIAPALFLQHALVNLAGGEIIGLLHACFNETLVMAQVKIRLGAVVGHKHLAMLKRRHGPRIDIQIGIKLDQGDFEAARFKDRS